jgi:hypothetical protein
MSPNDHSASGGAVTKFRPLRRWIPFGKQRTVISLVQVPAPSDKTWNHPVLISDRLYLRNSNEAVAYQLPVNDVRGGSTD